MEGNNEPLKDNTSGEIPTNTSTTMTAAPAPTQDQTQTPQSEPTFELNETNVMAALSYVGPLVFIPFFLKKSDPYVHYHIKQGLVVFAIGAIIWVLGNWFMVFHFLYPVMNIIWIGIFILSVIGVINALRHEEKNLPLVGQFARYFNF